MKIRKPQERVKKIYVFPDGTRAVSTGNLWISNTPEMPSEIIDVSTATEDEFEQLKINPHKKSLLDKLTQRPKKL